MHRPTIDVYEREGANYALRRGVQRPDLADAFAHAVPAGALRLDLGCGPGHHLSLLGRPAIALDGARAMVAASVAANPDVPAVIADLSHLPFGRATFGGVWASKVHQHQPAHELPASLAEVHRVLVVGGVFHLTMFGGPDLEPDGHREEVSALGSGDDLPGRLFTWWDPDRLSEVVAATGFSIGSVSASAPSADAPFPPIHVVAKAIDTAG